MDISIEWHQYILGYVTAPLWSSCAFLLFHLSNPILHPGVFSFQIKEWFQFNMLQAHLLVMNTIYDNKSSKNIGLVFEAAVAYLQTLFLLLFIRSMATIIMCIMSE